MYNVYSSIFWMHGCHFYCRRILHLCRGHQLRKCDIDAGVQLYCMIIYVTCSYAIQNMTTMRLWKERRLARKLCGLARLLRCPSISNSSFCSPAPPAPCRWRQWRGSTCARSGRAAAAPRTPARQPARWRLDTNREVTAGPEHNQRCLREGEWSNERCPECAGSSRGNPFP